MTKPPRRKPPDLKPLYWVGSCLKDLKVLPTEVQQAFGYALHLAQEGSSHPNAKRLKGLGGGVVEVVEDFDGDTFRAIYTVRFASAVYVLHAFQKKSTKGIATPKVELDKVEARLKAVAAELQRQKGKARK